MTVTGGFADLGGGLLLDRGELVITDSTIEDNDAVGGGGIATTAGRLTIVETTVRDNRATSADEPALGGGIYASSTTTTIERSTIEGNTATSSSAAPHGGGVHKSDGNFLTISDSTISGNAASGPGAAGGGLTPDFGAQLIRVTVVDNTATFTASGVEGNIFGDGVFITGSILDNAGTDCWGVETPGPYNIGSDSSCDFTGPTNLADTDPMLGPLADNGGPTLTHLPAAASPAIDSVPAGAGPCVGAIKDQRGVERPEHIDCDRGAVEQ
jgi:hypothetical protein